MNKRHNLNRLAYFVATVEEGSITKAADYMDISKAVVSKQLKLLEEDIGVTLLLRNTRHIQLSDAGLAFYEASKVALLQANEAFESVIERNEVPKGKIRITAPVDFGLSKLSPLIARFREQYPQVEVDVFFSDEPLDIIEHRYDFAFRVGWLEDSNYRARKLQDFEEVVVCSPKTLKKISVNQPEDLCSLPFIANQALKGLNRWEFQRKNKQQTVILNTALSMNITLAIRDAVIAGDSFSILPDFLIKQELADNKLVRLLPEWSLREGGIYLMSPPNRLRTKAVRAFLEMIKENY